MAKEPGRTNLERQMWKACLHLKDRKDKLEYETEKLPYTVTHKGNYIPDFCVELANGKKFYIEVKGYLRPTDMKKMLAVKVENPSLDIRLVFQTNNKLSARSKVRYVDWAEKYGFPCAVGHIPKEWFDETAPCNS